MHRIGMARNTGSLSDTPIPLLDLDRLVKILQCERQRVIEAVVRFGKQRAQMIVRKMAVVADRHMAMSRVLPRVIVALHHVTIRARCRLAAEVTPALAIAESEHPDSSKNAEHRRQSD